MNLRDRCAASLMGVAIGDGLFAIVEKQTHEQIMQLNEGRGVIDFTTNCPPPTWAPPTMKAGDITDDTSLTFVVGNSILNRGEYDPIAQALALVEALEETQAFGWGGTTMKSAQEMQKFFATYGKEGKSPLKRVSEGECGNGIAMKIAPLALFYFAKRHRAPSIFPPSLLRDVMTLAFLTHPDPRAGIAAYTVAVTILSVLRTPITTKNREDHRSRLESIATHIVEVERYFECYQFGSQEDQISSKLRLAAELLDDPDALREVIDPGFHAVKSVPFSIAMFFHQPCNFVEGILKTGNAGGDTDSNASMYGAMAGANLGLSAIPSEWQSVNPAFAQAKELGYALYDLAVS